MKNYLKYINNKKFKRWISGKSLKTDRRILLLALQKTFHLPKTGLMDERTLIRLSKVTTDREFEAVKQITNENLQNK